jgi:hypothetical protein
MRPEFNNSARKGGSCRAMCFGASDGIRTRDQELGKLLLYQLSYARTVGGGL